MTRHAKNHQRARAIVLCGLAICVLLYPSGGRADDGSDLAFVEEFALMVKRVEKLEADHLAAIRPVRGLIAAIRRSNRFRGHRKYAKRIRQAAGRYPKLADRAEAIPVAISRNRDILRSLSRAFDHLGRTLPGVAECARRGRRRRCERAFAALKAGPTVADTKKLVRRALEDFKSVVARFEGTYGSIQQARKSLVASSGRNGENQNSEPPYMPALQKKAGEGDPSAMLTYGLALLEGKSLPQDAGAAAKWIGAAAGAGDRRAVYLLSILLEDGIGVDRDPKAAAELLNKAAETGLPQALFLRAQKTADTRPGRALRDIKVAAAQAYKPAVRVLKLMVGQQQRRKLSESKPARAEPKPASSTALVPGAGKNVLIAIQALLNRLGYEAGTPNGNLSPETKAAIVMFQISENLVTDGQPSTGLRDRIIEVLRKAN
ncbi:MAG: SEL1-like repeat protein [Rhodobacteraceae bacterium]|nr:SEL1-like repeat protein [Paracoccaceae bacterium]